jgi:hypothetical protein
MIGLVDAAMSALGIIYYLLYQVTLTIYVCMKYAKSIRWKQGDLAQFWINILSADEQLLFKSGHKNADRRPAKINIYSFASGFRPRFIRISGFPPGWRGRRA